MKGKESLKGGDAAARKAAAALMGSARTEKKAVASRANGRLAPPGPGKPPVPLFSFSCPCEVGDALEGHRWNCPRGQAIKRRIAQGRDVLTGKPLGTPEGEGAA